MGSFSWNPTTNEILWSDNMYQLYGLEPSGFKPSIESASRFIHPDDVDIANSVLGKLIAEKKSQTIAEYRIITAEDKILWLHGTSHILLDVNGEIKELIGTVLDITERKKAEELLLKNKNRLDHALLKIGTGAWELDLKTMGSWRSFQHDQIFGYNKPLEEWTYDTFLKHVVAEDKEMVNKKFQASLSDKTDWDFECRIKRNDDGKIRWIWANSNHEYNEQKESIKIYGIVQDITEQKIAEDKLRGSEVKFKSLMQQSPFIVELYDLDGLQVSVNKAYEELWGFPAETTLFKLNLLESKEVEDTGLLEYIKRAYAGESVDVPVYMFDPTGDTEAKGKGRVRWLSTRVYPIKDEFEKVVNIVIVHQDVTDQKQYEEDLMESLQREQLLADIVRESSVGIAIGYPDGRLGMCNLAYQQITGYNEKELKTINWNKVLTPPEWEEVESAKLQEINRTRKPVKYEKEYIRKDGSRVPVELLVNPRLDDRGEVEYYFAFVIDISERKKVENALKESEERFRSIVEQSPLSTQMFTPDGMTAQVNRAYEDLWGISLEELKGYNILEDQQLVSQGIMPYIQGAFSGEAASIPVIEYDSAKSLGTGKKMWVQSRIYPVKDNAGNIDKVILIHEDITERKQAETALRENEILLKQTQEISKVGGWSYEVKTGESKFTDEIYKIYGLPVGAHFGTEQGMEFYHPDYQEIISEAFSKIITEGIAYDLEVQFINAKGGNLWVRTIGNAVFDGGKVVKVNGILMDITDSKQAETELLESKSFFEQLFIQSSTSTQLLDREGWCIRINPILSELFGVMPEYIEGKKYNILKDDEIIRTGVIKHLKRVFEKKETVRWEVNFDIQHASESTKVKVSKPEKKWFSNIAYPILDTQGDLIYVIVQHEDITERKIAESHIKESEYRLAALINNTSDHIWSFDRNYNYIIFNNTYSKMFFNEFGVELKKGLNSKDFLKPEELDFWVPLCESVFEGENKTFEFAHNFNGIIHYFQTSLNPIYEGDIVTGVSAMSVNITEVKTATHLLKESEERFNLAVKGSNDAIWDWDNMESDEYWWSDRLYEILGYKPDEVEARISNWKKWTHPGDSATVMDALTKHFNENSPYQVEFRMLKKGGDYVWVSVRGESVRDENGKPVRMVGSMTDITERKLAEDELEQHRKNLEKLVIERTIELERKNTDLERMNKLFVGRELRMVELKEKIAQLELILKNPQK